MKEFHRVSHGAQLYSYMHQNVQTGSTGVFLCLHETYVQRIATHCLCAVSCNAHDLRANIFIT